MGNADKTVQVVAGASGCGAAVDARAVAVLVDALRASATITSLIAAGAGKIWVATHVAQARQLQKSLPGALLIGERGGLPPPGFDAGNSPEQAAKLPVGGQDAVFTSTTGATRLVQLRGAAAAFVGGPVNATAVASVAAARAEGRPIYVVAAGLRGRQGGTEEDWLGAALIARGLARLGYRWIHRDQGRGRQWPDRITASAVAEGFAASPNGRRLAAIGLGADVSSCSRLDWLTAVAEVVAYEKIDSGPPVAVLRSCGASPPVPSMAR